MSSWREWICVPSTQLEFDKKAFIHFIEKHLGTDIDRLDLSDQGQVDNDILRCLAGTKNAGGIRFLDLMSTNVGYNGIVDLLKSETFGCIINALPTYERQTGLPVSIIEIEIGNTPLYDRYKRKLFNYPLPFRDDFEITYGHKYLGIGKPWSACGYKQIKLLYCGKELKSQKKIILDCN